MATSFKCHCKPIERTNINGKRVRAHATHQMPKNQIGFGDNEEKMTFADSHEYICDCKAIRWFQFRLIEFYIFDLNSDRRQR